MSFTAAELEAAIENPHEDDDEWEGWSEIGYAQEPNPAFDAEKAAESDRLYHIWRNRPTPQRWDGEDPDYRVYVTFREDNKGVLSATRPCAPTVEVNGVTYPIEVVADHGGGEGSGEERWIVIKVDGRLFRKDGYYMSYEGSTFDSELREVSPVVKEVTFYE